MLKRQKFCNWRRLAPHWSQRHRAEEVFTPTPSPWPRRGDADMWERRLGLGLAAGAVSGRGCYHWLCWDVWRWRAAGIRCIAHVDRVGEIGAGRGERRREGGVGLGAGIFGESHQDGDAGGGQGGARDGGPIYAAAAEGLGDDGQRGDERGADQPFDELEQGALGGREVGVGASA